MTCYIHSECYLRETDLVGWLVCWLLWVQRPYETVFQSISGRLPERGEKRRERIEESKNVQKKNPPAPTASAIGLALLSSKM